jgi:hypothetical protein
MGGRSSCGMKLEGEVRPSHKQLAIPVRSNHSITLKTRIISAFFERVLSGRYTVISK